MSRDRIRRGGVWPALVLVGLSQGGVTAGVIRPDRLSDRLPPARTGLPGSGTLALPDPAKVAAALSAPADPPRIDLGRMNYRSALPNLKAVGPAGDLNPPVGIASQVAAVGPIGRVSSPHSVVPGPEGFPGRETRGERRAVPEPASLLLLVTGLIGLAARRRLRRNAGRG